MPANLQFLYTIDIPKSFAQVWGYESLTGGVSNAFVFLLTKMISIFIYSIA